jgi:beta-lactamase regulating signal transducer with metallopeptidase domain
MMETLIGLGLKSLLIAGVTLGLLHLTRRRSAADRSWIAHLGLFALVALPLASLALPALSLEVLPTEAAEATAARLPAAVPADLGTSQAAIAASASSAPAATYQAPIDWTPYAYAVPVVALLLVTLLALLRLFALRSRAQVLVDPVWLGALAHAQRRMGFKNGTALLTSSELSSPISWGLVRPVILLNDEALAASGEAEAIIAHELAHVARLDWAKLMLARVATAMFWFNPLAWVLAREAHQLREEAADDAVLASNIADTDYAQLLVGVARHECRGLLLGAHGISPGKGSLRRRVSRVLDAGVARGAGGRSWVAGFAAGMLVMSAPLAALTFAPRPPEPPKPPKPLRAVAPQVANDVPPAPLAPLAPHAPHAPAAPLAPHAPHAPHAPLAPFAPVPPAELGAAISASVSSAVSQSVAAALAARDLHGADHASREARKALAKADRAIRAAERSHRVAVRAHPAGMTKVQLLGVTPAYVASIRAAGPQFRRLSEDDIIELRVKGVTADYIRALNAAGYGHETADEIGDAAVLGLSADAVRRYSQAGPRRSLEELTELRVMGVTPEFIIATRRAGHPPLSADELIEMRFKGQHPGPRHRTP